jgi:hypothetical protein
MWHLFTVEKIRGPFLVIAPLSTISKWKREIEKWTGTWMRRTSISPESFLSASSTLSLATTDMNVLVYQAPRAARQVIRQHEWNYLDAEVWRAP